MGLLDVSTKDLKLPLSFDRDQYPAWAQTTRAIVDELLPVADLQSICVSDVPLTPAIMVRA